jgi:hypothetical protein
LNLVNGVSSVKESLAAALEFSSSKIEDFKFVDDEEMMILLSKGGE